MERATEAMVRRGTEAETASSGVSTRSCRQPSRFSIVTISVEVRTSTRIP